MILLWLLAALLPLSAAQNVTSVQVPYMPPGRTSVNVCTSEGRRYVYSEGRGEGRAAAKAASLQRPAASPLSVTSALLRRALSSQGEQPLRPSSPRGLAAAAGDAPVLASWCSHAQLCCCLSLCAAFVSCFGREPSQYTGVSWQECRGMPGCPLSCCRPPRASALTCHTPGCEHILLQHEIALFREIRKTIGWKDSMLNWTCWDTFGEMLDVSCLVGQGRRLA